MENKFKKYALAVPDILLPDEKYSLERWAVIACDQFTSEPSYWDRVAELAGNAPSAYHIIYPECYLAEGAARIEHINAKMDEYLKDVLTRTLHGFMLVRRETNAGDRLGLVAAVDLEQYDFAPGAASLIRPTEGTITDRLPPRIAIRKDAPIETPHIMMLIDDPGMTLIEPLQTDDAPLYDFELMSGGRIRGWHVTEEAYQRMLEALEGLYQASGGLLFAVGDGNHSLATARQCWLNLKQTLPPEEVENHPARYALVEINNIHSPAMAFEPIHRAVFGADRAVLAHDFTLWCKQSGMCIVPCSDEKAQLYLLDAPVRIENALNPLPVANLQAFLDHWLKDHPECSIDYIHGTEALEALSHSGAACIKLSAIDKYSLFDAVRVGGVLPRKTFSLGEATDKRYYLECRKIR